MDDGILELFGARVRHYRERRGYSQEELGHRANISRNHISDIELGKRNIALKNTAAIAAALNVKLYQLMPDWKLPAGK